MHVDIHIDEENHNESSPFAHFLLHVSYKMFPLVVSIIYFA